MKKPEEYIVCAAIYYDDGEVHEHQPVNIEIGYVICGFRHCNCIQTMAILFKKSGQDAAAKMQSLRDNQGFLTSNNRFVGRKDAYFIAKERGQIIHDLIDESYPRLCSEDIY